ncbi:MAG: MlaD family protein [Alphaproteobacteria bacterium]
MGAKANPKLIGAFVVGAIVLLVVGVLVFGSGRFFQERNVVVAVFEGSIKGLNVGAPATYRGVKIGTVSGIRALFDHSDQTIQIPVFITIEPDRFGELNFDPSQPVQPYEEELAFLVDRGLRARLETQSLVTGLLAVTFEFLPDTEPIFRSKITDVPEVPTVKSALEEVQATVSDVAASAPELMANANQVLTQLSELLGGENKANIEATLQNLTNFTDSLASKSDEVVGDAAGTMANLRDATGKLQELFDRGGRAADAIERVADSVDGLIERDTENLGAAVTNVEAAAGSVGAMADEIQGLVAENREGVKDFSENTLFELSGLLVDTQTLVNTLNRVAEDIERDPARFFFGDQQAGVGRGN